MPDRLTGAFIELYKVTLLGDPGETETKVAETREDVVITYDTTTAETRAHNEEKNHRKPIAYNATLSFGGLLVSDLGGLSTLGFKDVNKIRGFAKAALEALRIKVYKDFGDATAGLVVDCETVEMLLKDISWPMEGYAQWTGEGYVNGDVNHKP